jgi:hypothetical protein
MNNLLIIRWNMRQNDSIGDICLKVCHFDTVMALFMSKRPLGPDWLPVLFAFKENMAGIAGIE